MTYIGQIHKIDSFEQLDTNKIYEKEIDMLRNSIMQKDEEMEHVREQLLRQGLESSQVQQQTLEQLQKANENNLQEIKRLKQEIEQYRKQIDKYQGQNIDDKNKNRNEQMMIKLMKDENQ